MAMKTEAAPKRTEVKDIPKSKRELTGKDLKKIKGGFEPVNGLIGVTPVPPRFEPVNTLKKS